MKIVRPFPLANAQVVNSNATEAHPNWGATTTYASGAKVVRGDSVYESAQASNLGKDPLTQPTWWVRLGPSNRMAMFDGQTNQPTTRTPSLSVSVMPGNLVDAVAMVGLVGDFAKVTVRDGGPSGAVGYTQTQALTGGESTSWSQYFFFDPFTKRTQALFTDIAALFNNPYITLEVWGAVGVQVAVGEAIVGRKFEIGCTQYGPTAGITDFSRKETDEFGNATFVKRAYSKRLSVNVMLDNVELNRVHRTLSDVRATPLLWIASDLPQMEEPLTVYGFYRDFSTQIAYPTHSLVAIEIEGLI